MKKKYVIFGAQALLIKDINLRYDLKKRSEISHFALVSKLQSQNKCSCRLQMC